MKHQWSIEKSGRKWTLKSQPTLDDGTVCPWHVVGTYPTRKAAVTIGMILRERGERITWQGGAIKMGLGMVAPHAETL